MKPRKHHEVIKQWADGAEVYMRKDAGEKWRYTADPAFVEDYEYCIGPVREYVQTSLTPKELAKVYAESPYGWEEGYIAVANAALRHAIDHGQVVTREEFDRAIGDRKARDYKIAKSLQAYFANMFQPMSLNRAFAEAIDIKEVLDRMEA